MYIQVNTGRQVYSSDILQHSSYSKQIIYMYNIHAYIHAQYTCIYTGKHRQTGI